MGQKWSYTSSLMLKQAKRLQIKKQKEKYFYNEREQQEKAKRERESQQLKKKGRQKIGGTDAVKQQIH